MVTTSGPSTLTVTWMAPLINGDTVTEYFIECDSADDGFPPQNSTRRQSLSAPFYNLTPNTTYNCIVIALSPFGNSDPATAQATTSPRDSKCLCIGVSVQVYVPMYRYRKCCKVASLLDDAIKLAANNYC